jgi:hypothetical protein
LFFYLEELSCCNDRHIIYHKEHKTWIWKYENSVVKIQSYEHYVTMVGWGSLVDEFREVETLGYTCLEEVLPWSSLGQDGARPSSRRWRRSYRSG